VTHIKTVVTQHSQY